MSTKELIDEKSQALLAAHGISGLGINGVAALLNISEAEIKQYYKDDQALLEEMIHRTINLNQKRCEILSKQCDDEISELFFKLVHIKSFYAEINATIVKELEQDHQKIYQRLLQHTTLFQVETLKSTIERGIEKGIYKSDLMIDLIVDYMLKSINLILSDPAHNKTLQAESIFGFLISGMVTQRGNMLVNNYKNQRGIMQLIQSEEQPFWDH